MSTIRLRNAIIPELKKFLGVPIIEGNQNVTAPDGDHGVFTFILSDDEDTGLESVETRTGDDGKFYMRYEQDFKSTMSLTMVVGLGDNVTHSVAKDKSYALTLAARNWFTFAGRSVIISNGIAITELSGIQSRDSINEDEYRTGFDITIRHREVMETEHDYFTQIFVEEERG